MTLASYVLLALTILLSSFISGVFGMAGGMILLGVLLNYFNVASAMILFSIIQFCANGWRAWQWRRMCFSRRAAPPNPSAARTQCRYSDPRPGS